MLIKTKAFVLHYVKYGDASLIVDLFTQSHGRLTFMARVPQSPKGRLKRQLFQPLNVLDVDFDYRQNVSMQKFRDVRIAVPFVSIPFDGYKLSISFFVAEFLFHSLREEQQNNPLFEYVVSSIAWLDSCTRQFSNFHLVFLMRLSRFLGFFPNLDDNADYCYFDLREGCFCKTSPLHPDFLQPDEAGRIKLLMRMNYETMHLYTMTRQERERCIEVMISYYKLHIPDFREMKSLDVLREMFD
jgi:DNA repair protein RecO (recombination protein O)